jgi:lysophospholipase L1-like esterase
MIVLYAGDNDLGLFGVAPDRVLAKYLAFVAIVRAALPDTPVYFVSIKPSIKRWHTWQTSVYTNQLIEAHTKTDPLLHYIDVASSMLLEGGDLNTSLFAQDDLHLNAQGYQVWKNVIQPVLANAYPVQP